LDNDVNDRCAERTLFDKRGCCSLNRDHHARSQSADAFDKQDRLLRHWWISLTWLRSSIWQIAVSRRSRAIDHATAASFSGERLVGGLPLAPYGQHSVLTEASWI
jgi:hypothetical protein